VAQSLVGWLVVDVLIAVLVVVASVITLLVRRRILERDGGFELCLRLHPGRWGGGWVFGIGRYEGDRIAWFKTFGLSLRARRCLPRQRLEVIDRHWPNDEDRRLVPSGHVVLACRVGGRTLDMSMEEQAVTGFLAWLEAAPPGQHLVA
jgi:Protein of unknown function (DUF2550)